MNGRFTKCDICGGLGHSARSCALRKIEERRDPMGEAMRRQAIRQRERERLQARQPAIEAVQSSRTIGM